MINHIERICINCLKEKPNRDSACPYCGFDAKGYHSSASQLPPFTILYGKYLLGRVIGQGGFGIVYIAKDLVLDINVAIKELFPSNMVTRTVTEKTGSTSVICMDDPRNLSFVRDKFVKEARTIAHLQQTYGAGGIVQVKDLFEENNTAYLVMEYLDGETLKQYLDKNGTIECSQLLGMIRPVIDSLDSIHKADIIHRDISADNIMVLNPADALHQRGTPLLKLLDFGNFKIQDPANERSHSVFMAVKKGYSPIEQYSLEGKIGPWTDVYAMCATIYRCLTGKLPPEPTALAGGSITPPSHLGISIPHSTERTLMKGLALNYHERIQNMEELTAGLYAKPIASATTPMADSSRKRGKKVLPVVIGGIAGVLIIGCLIWYFIIKKDGNAKTQSRTETISTAQSESVKEIADDIQSEPVEETTSVLQSEPANETSEIQSESLIITSDIIPTEPVKETADMVSTEPAKETADIVPTEPVKDTSDIIQTELIKETAVEAQEKNTESAQDSIFDTQQNTPDSYEKESSVEKEEDTSADQKAAATVTEMINSLPETISLDDESAIQEARSSYDNLSDAQKELVSSITISRLINAEAELNSIKKAESEAVRQSESDQKAADAFIQVINEFPESISLNEENSVQEAREIYDNLTEDQKGLVSSTAFTRLTDAEAALASLKKAESEAARQSESDQAAADVVIQKINEIPDVITLNEEAAVQAAQESYDNLTDNQKQIIPEESYNRLLDAEAQLSTLKESLEARQNAAQDIINTIDSLPGDVTAEDESVIIAARASYDALDDETKALVTNLSGLEAAEAALNNAKQAAQSQTAWEICKPYYAQKIKDTITQYGISPSANPFDGEVKGFCYAALAGNCGIDVPYLILCWRGDNDLAFDTLDEGYCYAYYYEICSWDGTQVVTSLSSGTDAANSVNRYWISSIDGIDYWITWKYGFGTYDMIPLNVPGTRKVFYGDSINSRYYVNGSAVDEDIYLQMCSIAEASDNDECVSMTRTTGYMNIDEEDKFIPTSIDETYKELTGSALSHEISDSVWKTLYRRYLKKLGLKKNDTARIALAYLNDDDIPEMLIKQSSDELYYIIVTSDGISINIAMAPYANLKVAERSNQFMLWGQPDDYSGFAYVLSIRDGAFHWDAHGRYSRKEITESKINYMWNNSVLNSFEEYDNTVNQQIPGGVELIPEQTYDGIVAQLDALP